MRIIFLTFFIVLGMYGFSQRSIFQLPSYDIVRRGPYIGYQQGNYGIVELGYEKQWKDLKLFKAKTTAIFGGLNYNFSDKVIGFDLGIWRKLGFLGITYGAAGIYRTDLTHHKVGVSPMLGWKVGRFHLHLGYQFVVPQSEMFGVNEFYTTLRFKVWNKKQIKKS
jgi:hypothetical protein